MLNDGICVTIFKSTAPISESGMPKREHTDTDTDTDTVTDTDTDTVIVMDTEPPFGAAQKERNTE